MSSYGYGGRILRIDLSEMRISAQETAPYLPEYLGARGIAARICWDEVPEPVEPFDIRVSFAPIFCAIATTEERTGLDVSAVDLSHALVVQEFTNLGVNAVNLLGSEVLILATI